MRDAAARLPKIPTVPEVVAELTGSRVRRGRDLGQPMAPSATWL
jgi:hypothetical protein